MVRLGLRENLAQFSLLVIVNAFVGAMVGMERTILPAIAEADAFGLPAAMWMIAGLTFGSGLVVALRMTETQRRSSGYANPANVM